jgi:uncharacterized protein YcgI (DUF1989 family)
MDEELKSITLPPGRATAIPLQSGDEVKITSPEGGQEGDFTFVGFDQALRRNINGWEELSEVKLTFCADPNGYPESTEAPTPLEMALQPRPAP